jgi:rhomboid family GlyGly-CTERM serine protease
MSDDLPRNAAVISRNQAWWLLGLTLAALVLLSLGGENWQFLLRYERAGVLDRAEYWRFFTGHLVHGTPLHLLLNVLGLGLIAALFPQDYSLGAWFWICAGSMAAVDLGFVLYEPQLQWYVGLSGILHGALAAGAIAWWRHESKPLALALSSLFVAKLAWEQYHGALPLSGNMPVIVDAHLYGAIGGAGAASILWLRAQEWSWRRRSL